MIPLSRRCFRCSTDKPLDDFYRSRRAANGRQSACKTCQQTTRHSRYWGNVDESRAARRLQTLRGYGLTPESYDEMLAQQSGVCAICGQPEKQVTSGPNPARLAVDHDHATGRVRGLLCAQCNQGIGKFDHSPERLRQAMQYLEQP